MKKIIFGIALAALVFVMPGTGRAGVDIRVNIGLPPPFVFRTPPEVIALPDTNGVYVVPGIDIDLFFWNGWWWRLWEGRWYRSHVFDRGWVFYNAVPNFYYGIDPGWRQYYRDRNWYGHRWNYGPIPHRRLQENWRGWQKNRYWERHGNWGVENYQPRYLQQRGGPQGRQRQDIPFHGGPGGDRGRGR